MKRKTPRCGGVSISKAGQPSAERLEERRLLSGDAPVAMDHSYTVYEDQPLTVGLAVQTSLVMASDAGDYIGGGKTYQYRATDGTFSASKNYDNGVSINFKANGWPEEGDDWDLDFVAPDRAQLTPGTYKNAQRFPFQDPGHPGLDISGCGRGSNELTGTFTVKNVQFGGSGVDSFVATFEQHSEGGTPALRGTIKYNYLKPGTLSGVLQGTTDAEGDPLEVQLVSDTRHGLLTLNADGTFDYYPDEDFNGLDSFTYRVTDGTGLSQLATATLNVCPVNDAPAFDGGDDQTLDEDCGPVQVPGWASGISAGPADEASQPLTFVATAANPLLFSQQPHVDASTGTLCFTPAANASGSTVVTVVLKDSGGTANKGTDTSSAAVFAITINPIDDAPVARDDAFATPVDQTLRIAPQAPFTGLIMTSDPGDYIGGGRDYSYGTGDGAFTVRKNYDSGVNVGFTGTDWRDDWDLAFAAPNNQPLVPGTYQNATRFAFHDDNVPGFELSGCGRGSNELTATFTVLAITYTPGGAIDQFAASFEQHSEGAVPALRGMVYYNYVRPQGVLVNDTDVDDPALTASPVSGPQHGQLALNWDGTFSYTPDPGFAGEDSFKYEVSDGTLASAATAVITVGGSVVPVATPLVIGGTDGNDAISILAFDQDYLVTANGHQTVYPVASVSTITINGGAGNDLINVNGIRTAVSIAGGAGLDTLFGGDGNDTLMGNGGNDLIFGGAGSDVLRGGVGDDSLLGGAGDDLIIGNAGNDILRGQGGADELRGGAGSDMLFGGAGNDLLMARDGATDVINGGGGADRAQVDSLLDAVGTVESMLA